MFNDSQLQEIQAGTRPLAAYKEVTLDGGIESGALAAKAAVVIDPAGTNNSLTWTAEANGTAGNGVSVEYRDPNVTIARPLDVSVDADAKKITIDLETANLTDATGTLTSSGVFSNGEEIVIDDVTYTMVSSLSAGPTVPYEVLIGASAAASLDNLKSAVNGTAGVGTTYSVGTEAHPTVEATTNDDTTQLFVALTGGTDGNAIVTTTDAADNAWGAGTLEGGLDGGQIISTADEIKTAIAASTEAAALVDVADEGSDDGSGVVTAMPEVNLEDGSDGKIPLFTVHGECLVSLRAYIEVAGAGTNATLVHGKTGTTNDLITILTVTNFTKGAGIDSTGVVARGTALAKTPLKLYHEGEDIFATVATAAATGGKLHYLADFVPLTPGAYVEAA